MRRIFRSLRTLGPTPLARQDGFTLVELLVGMVVTLIVIGGGTYGLALAFKNNTRIVSRTAASDQAEVGLQRLVLDLRQAVNGTCTSSDGKVTVSGVTVAYTTSPNTTTTISMCAPNGTVSSSAAGTVSVASYTSTSVPVVWTCNQSGFSVGTQPPYSCLRSLNDRGSINVAGIYSLTLNGLVSGGVTPTALQLAGKTNTYTLNAAASTGQTGTLSWVGLSARVLSLNSASTNGTATAPNSALVTVQTGADLGNYGE